MSKLDRLRNTDISPKTAAVYIIILLIVLSSVIFAVKAKVSTTPEPVAEEGTSVDSKHSVKVDIKENKKADSKAENNTQSKACVQDACWKTIADRNIFQGIVSQPAPSVSKISAKTPVKKGPSMPPKIGKVRPMPVGGLPPMAVMARPGNMGHDIAFTGIVSTPQGQFALLENTSTMETKYAAVGESVFGMRVVNVNPRSVTLDAGGAMVNLSIGENKSAGGSQPSAPPSGAPSGGGNPAAPPHP